MRKEVIQKLFVIGLLIIVIAVPVSAEPRFWSWLKLILSGSPTGAQVGLAITCPADTGSCVEPQNSTCSPDLFLCTVSNNSSNSSQFCCPIVPQQTGTPTPTVTPTVTPTQTGTITPTPTKTPKKPTGGGGGGSVSHSTFICVENNICAQVAALKRGNISMRDLKLWKRVPVYGTPVPGTLEASYPTYDGCINKNPTLGMKVFTKSTSSGAAMFDLPPDYPHPQDAERYYSDRNKFFTSLVYQARRQPVLPESIPLCPEIVFPRSEAECFVEDGVVQVYWTRGWHYEGQTGRINRERTGYVIDASGVSAEELVSEGEKAALEPSDIGTGVIDGGEQDFTGDEPSYEELSVKKFTPSGDWRLLLKTVVEDTLGYKRTAEKIITEADCKTCPLYIEAVGEDGKLQSFKNPCCDGRGGTCCDSDGNFLQGKMVPGGVGQCYTVTKIADGPATNACLTGLNKCDITSLTYLRDRTESTYRQFGWKPAGNACLQTFNAFTDSFASDTFSQAVGECPALPPECTPGTRRQTGTDVGACEPTVMQCDENGYWKVIVEGVRPESEVCDKQDNDCNGKVDDDIFCFDCRVGDSKPCTSEGSASQITGSVVAGSSECVERAGRTEWDLSPCSASWEEIDKASTPKTRSYADAPVYVAETNPGEFAVLSQTGLGAPCGDNEFACCNVYNKATDGPVEFSEVPAEVPSGYVKLLSYSVENCDEGELEIAANVPPVQDALALFRREEQATIVPAAVRTEAQCSGLDVQTLYDKATIPKISYVDVREGVVLSSATPILSALGITATFSGDIAGVRTRLDTADVEIRNKALAVLGQPLTLTVENPRPGINVQISAPLLLSKGMDKNSLGFYVLEDEEWNYVGGGIVGVNFVAELEDVEEVTTFMIAGSACDGCEEAYLMSVRDVDSPLLVVLVHGFYSSPRRSMAALLQQFEDEQVNVDVAVLGYAGVTPEDAASVLSEKLREMPHEKIVFIGHSLGGLVVREFLHKEEQREDSLIPKVEALIMAGTPNDGTPVVESAVNVFDISALLLNAEDNAPIAGVRKETLEIMSEGLPYELPDSVKVFTLVGTKDFLNIGRLFGLPPPHDAFVSSESVRSVGGIVLSSECVDTLQQPVDHLKLNKAPEQRYTLLYFLRQLSSEFNERAPPQMYAVVRIDDCETGELDIYGKPVDVKMLPPPLGCEMPSCADGICQINEVCPADCPEERSLTCDVMPVFVYALLIITLVLIISYAAKTRLVTPARKLLMTIYAFTAVSLLSLILSFAICKSLPLTALFVLGLIVIMLLIDFFTRANRGYYRWH